MVQQCTIKIRLYTEAGDTTRETRHDLGWTQRGIMSSSTRTRRLDGGRRAATCREENGRPHPERDLLIFRLVPQVRKGGDEESWSHLTRRRACPPRTDIRTTPAPRARRTPSPGIAIFGFFWVFIDRAFPATVRNYYWFCRETWQKYLRQFRGLLPAMYPFSDEERLCVCNTITTTNLLLGLLLL